jgi:hypothetical protein
MKMPRKMDCARREAELSTVDEDSGNFHLPPAQPRACAGMSSPPAPVRLIRGAASVRPGDSALAARLRREVDGEVLFDAASRGRYSTDASIYQIEPIGVVVRGIGSRCAADRG